MNLFFKLTSGIGIVNLFNKLLKILTARHFYEYQIERSISREQFFNFFRMIQPTNFGFDLIRVGPLADSGYVVPDDLLGVKKCISPGVGETIKFETQLLDNYNIQSYLADPTIPSPKNLPPGIFFSSVGISHVDGNLEIRDMKTNDRKILETKTLESFIDSNLSFEEKDLILQMDIENHEYLALLCTRIETLKKFRIMVIEFHSLPKIFNEKYFNEIIYPLFSKLNSEFYVAHIHPNNISKPVKLFGAEVPHAIEITFHNRNRVINRKFERIMDFNSELDRPCDLTKSEVVLDSKLFS